jgi:hypothetical protein
MFCLPNYRDASVECGIIHFATVIQIHSSSQSLSISNSVKLTIHRTFVSIFDTVPLLFCFFVSSKRRVSYYASRSPGCQLRSWNNMQTVPSCSFQYYMHYLGCVFCSNGLQTLIND